MGYTPSFTPEYENGWEDLPLETTPITADALNNYDDAIGDIEEYLASDSSQSNLADAYDETATYDVGDYVIYEGDLYKCTTAISEAEEWDSTHWTPVNVTDEMGHGGGGSIVTITPTLSTGTKIADFEIDGESGELYAPSGDNAVHYSTEEQVIGTWIDDSTLYEKTIDIGALPNSATSKSYAHGITGNIVRYDISAIDASGTVIQLPFYTTALNYNIGVYVTNTNIVVETQRDSSGYTHCYATLRYTKTSS